MREPQDLSADAYLRSNFFVIGIIPDLEFRFVLARNSTVAAEIGKNHGAGPRVQALLGQTTLGAFLLATHSVKTSHQVSLHLECEGPVYRLIAFAGQDGSLRATVGEPGVMWEGPLHAGKGSGILRVNRWQADRKQVYSSAVEMRSVDLDRNLEEYVARSDQIQSFIRLQSTFDAAGQLDQSSGYLFQALPDAGVNEIDRVLEMLGGRSPDEIFEVMMPSQDDDGAGGRRITDLDAVHPVSILRSGSFFAHCDCTRDKVRNVLFMLGREAVSDLVAEHGHVEVFCEFCRKRYEFAGREVQTIFPDG